MDQVESKTYSVPAGHSCAHLFTDVIVTKNPDEGEDPIVEVVDKNKETFLVARYSLTRQFPCIGVARGIAACLTEKDELENTDFIKLFESADPWHKDIRWDLIEKCYSGLIIRMVQTA